VGDQAFRPPFKRRYRSITNECDLACALHCGLSLDNEQRSKPLVVGAIRRYFSELNL